MTQTRAVLLGFAGMALVLVAGTGLFVWSFAQALAGPPPDAAEAQAINQVFDAKSRTFDPVRGIDLVLPVGLRWSQAEIALTASKFACKASSRGEICSRDARMGSCRMERYIEVGLDDDRRIASTTAKETPNCL